MQDNRAQIRIHHDSRIVVARVHAGCAFVCSLPLRPGAAILHFRPPRQVSAQMEFRAADLSCQAGFLPALLAFCPSSFFSLLAGVERAQRAKVARLNSLRTCIILQLNTIASWRHSRQLGLQLGSTNCALSNTMRPTGKRHLNRSQV